MAVNSKNRTPVLPKRRVCADKCEKIVVSRPFQLPKAWRWRVYSVVHEMESVKKFAALAGLLLGLVGQLISVILAFKKDFSTAIAASLVITFLITVVALITIIASKVPSRVAGPSQSIPRYSKLARRAASVVLVSTLVVPAISLWGWKVYRVRPNGRFLILVADFDGPNPKSFRVSEIIVEQIQQPRLPRKAPQLSSCGAGMAAQLTLLSPQFTSKLRIPARCQGFLLARC